MQRYRVNFPLLIGLVVGSILVIGGGFGLWRYQLSRNAGRLLDRAEVAREDGNLSKSISLLRQYVSIRPEDTDAMTQLANRFADLAADPEVDREDLAKALNQLETIVREQPDNVVLRRRMVDVLTSPQIRGYKQALDHIGQLLNRSPGDTELELLRSTCLFATNDPKRIEHAYRMVGYDQETREFDRQKAVAPDDVMTYVRLAVALQVEDDDKKLAAEVMDQLVENNSENGQAVLARGQFLVRNNKKDEGEAEIRRALEIAPELPAAVVANSQLLAEEEKIDEAVVLLEKCLADNPTDLSVHQTLASMEIRRKDYPAAIKRYEAGLAVIPPREAQMLAFYKARLQIESEDGDAARETIARMRELKLIAPPFLEYLEARLAMFEGKFVKAAREFERLSAFMEGVSDMRSELHFLRGFSYEKMGQFDKALDAYNVTLQGDPLNAMATYGKTRMEDRLGVGGARERSDTSIYSALTEELAKPEAEQDWDAFQPLIDEYVKRLNLGEAMQLVIEGEVLMRREKYPEARRKLVDSVKLDPDNLGVRRAAVKLFALDPEQGPVKALKLLDKVVEKFGDKPILRLEKADLLIRINDEDIRDQLLELTQGIEGWNNRDQIQLWSGLSQRFEQIRDVEGRQLCLSKVVELSPSDLQTFEDLFMMARQGDDESGMLKAQQRIGKIVGSKDDPVYKFTKAHLAVARYRSQTQEPALLAEADDAISKALASRPEWHQLHLLRAEVALLRNDERAALRSFDKAAQFGPPTAISLLQHVKLLVRQGRYADAVKAAERAPQQLRVALLGRDYAEALMASGSPDDAINVANQIADKASEDAAARLWHGNLLMRATALPVYAADKKRVADLTERAGESLKKAVEVAPDSSEAWLTWIGFLAANDRKVEAEDALREAHLRLNEDDSLLVFARCYELLGRWIDAEQRYLLALDDAIPNERPRAARLLAAFYASQFYPGSDKLEKATPLVNEILRAIAEGNLDANDPNARWARTAAARLLAGSGEYQKIRSAENLLSSNVVDGRLLDEDLELMAKILASRPEASSRLKAITLFEQLADAQRLPLQSELELSQLYYSVGEWRKCREQMINVIARYPEEPNVRVRYMRMLLERGGPTEIDEAVRQLRRLAELQPNDITTRELAARVAMKRGKQKEAIAALRSMLPRNLSQIKPEQTGLLLRVGSLLSEFDDIQNAEPMYKLAADRGGPGERLEYATFLGVKVDADRGMELLDKLRSEIPAASVVQRGLQILRARTNEGADTAGIGEKINNWLKSALREDPDLIALRMQSAELLDIKRDYEGASALYRKLLASRDLAGVNRAVVLNNFAYLLALADPSDQDVDEARKYVDEAVDLLGPGTDLLDTRAVVAMADERYSDAIADLELAVIDRPTADKYFHKATAHLMAGQTEEAIAAWKEAIARGLSAESVSRLEQDQFKRVKDQLEGLGMQSASL
ncbi:tetratricopeptide repeat protein [Botrimarina hoheduenensis]|uniref:Tetratricopeptide repeat protein n=1 Tax=Botrimarina hoheduenensis TaxID=2528000 RepID=A0A5C5W7J0_9BACT|nr:tetratricopeptide repeat protein [Botrimarina hoheduenensis]TWT46650.1 tetratricopeptide repeat protein [Botrimarina hoheduenensis]